MAYKIRKANFYLALCPNFFVTIYNHVIAHPGGPKVLKALEEALNLPSEKVKHTWESLNTHGNMSSVSVLEVLKRTLDSKIDGNGYALTTALGPAFCSEMGLFKCHS